MRRFTRLASGFSKMLDNQGHAVALHSMYCNYVGFIRLCALPRNGSWLVESLVGVWKNWWDDWSRKRARWLENRETDCCNVVWRFVGNLGGACCRPGRDAPRPGLCQQRWARSTRRRNHGHRGYSLWVGCFNTSFGSVGLATLLSRKCNRRITCKLNHYPMTLSTTISEVPVVK